MTTFTLDSITKKILENTNFSKTSSEAIAKFIIKDARFSLEGAFFSRRYDKEKKELIIDVNIQAILNVFKEFTTKELVDFIKNYNYIFFKEKIMAKGPNYILYRM